MGMKTRIGRPPKNGRLTLNNRLDLRVTPDEKVAYETAADELGLDRSDWIRLILNKASEKYLKGRR